MKKVSADTITELTISAATTPENVGAPPTVQELIDGIRATLTGKIKALSASEKNAEETAPPEKKAQPTAFHISREHLVRELEDFENIIADLPVGFRLAPVLYSTIKHRENAGIYSQFSSCVKPQFFRFLAENHAEELKALGICSKGIKRMTQGQKPVDESNRPYDVNVDHIIERFGGGRASLTEEVDPQMPRGSQPTHLTNHFANLMLMPRDVHERKNKLNEIQGASKTPFGESKWVLMIVPEVDAKHAGYVSQPQPTPLSSVPGVPQRSRRETALQNLVDATAQLNRMINLVLKSDDPKAVNVDLSIDRMERSLMAVFNTAAHSPRDLKDLRRFCDHRNFRSVREDLVLLPREKTEKLRHALDLLDTKISKRFNDNADGAKTQPVIVSCAPAMQQRPDKKKKHKKKSKRYNRR